MVHIDFFLDEDKELSEKQKEQFERLVKKAKELAKNGYVRQALELYQKALKIYHNEKLVHRINKMEVKLFCTRLVARYCVHRSLFLYNCCLFQYQQCLRSNYYQI